MPDFQTFCSCDPLGFICLCILTIAGVTAQIILIFNAKNARAMVSSIAVNAKYGNEPGPTESKKYYKLRQLLALFFKNSPL